MESFDFLCRICLATCEEDDEVCESVIIAYMDLTGYVIKPDNEPKKVCQTCLNAMLNFRTFKHKAREVEIKILELKRDLYGDTGEELDESQVKLPLVDDELEDDDDDSDGAFEETLQQHNNNDATQENNFENQQGYELIDDQIEYLDEDAIIQEDNSNIVEYVEGSEQLLEDIIIEEDVPAYEEEQLSQVVALNEIEEIPVIEAARQVESRNNRIAEEVPRVKKGRLKHEYFCEMCQKNFMSKYAFNHHNAVVHVGFIPYFCDICDNDFPYKSKIYLKRHMVTKHFGSTYPCEDCSVVCPSRGALFAHRNKFHADKIIKNFGCLECNKKFVSQMSLEVHMRCHKVDKAVCGDCGKAFLTKERLFDHKKLEHTALYPHLAANNAKKHNCNVCSSTFDSIHALNTHWKTHQYIGFQCPACSQRFTVPSSLRTHVKRYHPDVELPPPGTSLKGYEVKEPGKFIVVTNKEIV